MSTPTFSDLPYERPDIESVKATAAERLSAWDAAEGAEAQLELIAAWDAEQIGIQTLQAIAGIHFAQDATDAERKAEKVFFDTIRPDLAEIDLDFLRKVTTSPHRKAIEGRFGAQALALWDLRLTTFDPRIADLKRRESELENEYDEIRASIKVEFEGETLTLSTLRAYYGNADRDLRHRALQAQSAALAEHEERLDAIYDDLVDLRSDMAEALGYDNFVPLGYANLGRTDYGPGDVETFRAQVRAHVLPLAERIRARRAKALGVDRYGFRDEWVRDDKGSPDPKGDYDFMLRQARGMFAEMGEDFGAFFELMVDKDLMDLKSRPGKVAGGFCEALTAHRLPFIFANFNGTQADVQVFTHECGHAFQYYNSRDLDLRDYFWPTLEACEIHSMGLEYLTFPHMERFFGEDAERFRLGHVEDAILFLCYGSAVDEFQHRVYSKPGLTPEGRAAAWHELEDVYLDNRRYEGMSYFESGRYWQRQGHIYHEPFYYIDYCLAEVCALQLWRRATEDREATMALYRELCRLGGSMPFTELLAHVGLDNPLEAGCLEGVVGHVERELGL